MIFSKADIFTSVQVYKQSKSTSQVLRTIKLKKKRVKNSARNLINSTTISHPHHPKRKKTN